MEAFLNSVNEINNAINGVVWGVPMLLLIVGAGIWLTIGSGFFQFAKFGHAMKNTIGKMFEKKAVEDKGAVSPFQAVTTALAATVGTGNIAGVAGAIALGGPGAVFWMWISALFGMATKYAEVVLAIKFRERNAKGDWVGGPMYYITKGLGKKWRWLAVLFAAFGALAAFGIGNMTQINTIASSIFTAVSTVSTNPNVAQSEMLVKIIVGVVVAAVAGLVLIGGLKRIARVTEKLVPVMSVIYILSCLTVIFMHIGSIGEVFRQIFVGAFNPSAVVGGVVGITIAQSMRRGVSRGVFSNEAGLGSAPIAHAAADTDNPVKQGLYGIFEVFMDTIVICTLTGLTILISGTSINFGQSAGVDLTVSAFTTSFGGSFASVVVAVGITLFAGSTILSWALYGIRCTEYLFGTKSILPYQILFILFIIVGATMELSLAWNIADTLNGLMAIPNLIAVLGLSGLVIKLTREYREQIKVRKLDA